MKSAIDVSENNLMLLSTLDLDEVCEAVSAIVSQVAESKAIAVMVWDADLDAFNDKYVYGPRKKDFKQFVDKYAEDCQPDWSAKGSKVAEVDLDDVDARLPSGLEPLYSMRIGTGDKPVALLLLAGCDEVEPDELEEELSPYPLQAAISNAWEVQELKRENEMLRARYEELEDQNSMLEEQTRKLIHDTMARDSLRTQHTDKERLVFEISNNVRSSLEIQQVLQTAVNKIGETFKLSRCLLLRPVVSNDTTAVFEYHDSSVASVKELFDGEMGLEFVRMAFKKTAPHDFCDPNMDDASETFNKQFLKQMGLLSGLLVPLILRDRNIGTIFLQDCQTPREWSIDNTALFGSLADQLSVAIENADLHEEKKMQAVTDGLTGIANRRHFNETFTKEFERAKRYDEPLSLIVVDLDFLKKINDTYGHHVGDQAIQKIGQVLGSSCRSIDLPARYGGEEFCLLLPNTDLEMAEIMAERVRKLISEVAIEGPGHISASIGVSNLPLHATEPDKLFEAADQALYAAKSGGRNRVCVAVGQDQQT
jgi:diguanylate cyclase (GGDEF)-like protein